MSADTLLTNFNFAVQIELSGLGGDEGLAQGARRAAFSEVQGLEITLTLANSGEITRLFLLTPGGSQ